MTSDAVVLSKCWNHRSHFGIVFVLQMVHERLPPLVRAFLTRLSSHSAAEQTWQLALTLQQPLPWLESTAPFSQPRQSPRVSLATEAWWRLANVQPRTHTDMRTRSTLAHDEHLKVEENHMSTGNVWDKRLEPRPSTVCVVATGSLWPLWPQSVF